MFPQKSWASDQRNPHPENVPGGEGKKSTECEKVSNQEPRRSEREKGTRKRGWKERARRSVPASKKIKHADAKKRGLDAKEKRKKNREKLTGEDGKQSHAIVGNLIILSSCKGGGETPILLGGGGETFLGLDANKTTVIRGGGPVPGGGAKKKKGMQ